MCRDGGLCGGGGGLWVGWVGGGGRGVAVRGSSSRPGLTTPRPCTLLLLQLTLTYNRTRQASITTELIEIISGATALAG